MLCSAVFCGQTHPQPVVADPRVVHLDGTASMSSPQWYHQLKMVRFALRLRLIAHRCRVLSLVYSRTVRFGEANQRFTTWHAFLTVCCQGDTSRNRQDLALF